MGELGEAIELIQAVTNDIERPTDPTERLRWLEQHHRWLRAADEILKAEMGLLWVQEQIERDTIHGQTEL